MGSGGAKPAAPTRGVEPPVGRATGRIGDKVGVRDYGREARLADVSAGEDAGEQGVRGDEAELVGDVSDAIGGSGPAVEILGLGKIEGEGLFADDVAAGVERLGADLVVLGGAGGDDNDIWGEL